MKTSPKGNPSETTGLFKGLAIAAIFTGAAMMSSGCSFAPTHGGEEVNQNLFKSEQDFLSKYDKVKIGDSIEDVLKTLGLSEQDLSGMSRSQVTTALYSDKAQIRGDSDEMEKFRQFLSDLTGYYINYKNVKKDHAMSSINRITTVSQGYDYRIPLIFKDGKLFDKPEIPEGGKVHAKDAKPIIKTPAELFKSLVPGV